MTAKSPSSINQTTVYELYNNYYDCIHIKVLSSVAWFTVEITLSCKGYSKA